MEQTIQFGVSFDVTPGPDGKNWARTTYVSGNTAYVFTLPIANFKRFLEQMAIQGADLIKQMERDETGFVIARETALEQIPKLNREARRHGVNRR